MPTWVCNSQGSHFHYHPTPTRTPPSPFWRRTLPVSGCRGGSAGGGSPSAALASYGTGPARGWEALDCLTVAPLARPLASLVRV